MEDLGEQLIAFKLQWLYFIGIYDPIYKSICA